MSVFFRQSHLPISRRSGSDPLASAYGIWRISLAHNSKFFHILPTNPSKGFQHGQVYHRNVPILVPFFCPSLLSVAEKLKTTATKGSDGLCELWFEYPSSTAETSMGQELVTLDPQSEGRDCLLLAHLLLTILDSSPGILTPTAGRSPN